MQRHHHQTPAVIVLMEDAVIHTVSHPECSDPQCICHELEREQRCPFCPILLPGQPELWDPVGATFFGEPATIGDIPACHGCATVAEIADNAAALIQALREEQSRSRTDEQRANRQAWKDYCAPEHLSQQRIRVDRMKCTGCGKETLVAHLNDSGRCDDCCQ